MQLIVSKSFFHAKYLKNAFENGVDFDGVSMCWYFAFNSVILWYLSLLIVVLFTRMAETDCIRTIFFIFSMKQHRAWYYYCYYSIAFIVWSMHGDISSFAHFGFRLYKYRPRNWTGIIIKFLHIFRKMNKKNEKLFNIPKMKNNEQNKNEIVSF